MHDTAGTSDRDQDDDVNDVDDVNDDGAIMG